MSKGSYDGDDREFLNNFLDIIKPKKTPSYSKVDLPDNLILTKANLTNSELNSLYSIAGYLISSITKTCICI